MKWGDVKPYRNAHIREEYAERLLRGGQSDLIPLEDRLGVIPGDIDLNLLVIFDAIMQDRSITKAAARLHLTQPVVSHALSRLRKAFLDELFVPAPGSMVPTPEAERLAEKVRSSLAELRAALKYMEPFAPATTEERFTIGIGNQSALVLAVPLALAVAAEAPRVSLDFRAGIALDMVADRLDRGELDLAIGETFAPSSRFSDRRLYHDRLVVLMREGHPAAAPSALTLPTFAALPHLETNYASEHTEFIDQALARENLSRRVALRAPLYVASMTLLKTDMIAVMSERTARALMQLMPLAIAPLPFPSPDLTTAMAVASSRRRLGAPSLAAPSRDARRRSVLDCAQNRDSQSHRRGVKYVSILFCGGT